MKKGQAWSIDAMVGVFLFVMIIISVIAFSVSQTHNSDMANLKQEGEELFSALRDKLNVINERKIDPALLETLNDEGYESLKNFTGISSDFCIYFVDENDNLVFLDELGEMVGIGSSKVLINGTPCNST